MSEGWSFLGDIFAREEIRFIPSEENIGKQIESMKKVISISGEKLVLFTAMGESY